MSATTSRSNAAHLVWLRPRLPAFGWLWAMAQAAATRKQLAALDDRMLRDLGISRADALEEAARRPWDLTPPAGRRG